MRHAIGDAIGDTICYPRPMPRAGRRSNHEGSVSQRPDGTWRARILLAGRHLEKRVPNRKAGLDWIGQQVDDWEATGQAPIGRTPTLDVWLRTWLDRLAVGGKKGTGAPRSPNTINEYRKKIDSYLIPALGQMKLREITPDHIVGWQKSMLAGGIPGTDIKLGGGKGLSSRTIRSTQVILKAALDDAVRRRDLLWNPARAVDLVALNVSYEPIEISTDQWRRAIDLALDSLSAMGIYVVIAAMMGLRRGEILGIKWGSVHLNDDGYPWVQVGESVQRVGTQGLLTMPGKNEYSRRELALPPTVAGALREIKRTNGWVVTGDQLREPADVARRAWDPIRNELGLPQLRLHELRHHLVTEMGRNPKLTEPIRKAWFGHTPEDVHTRVYFERLRDDTRVVAAEIEELYRGA